MNSRANPGRGSVFHLGEVQRLEALWQVVGRLDDGLRAVVILRYEQGFSVAETAQALDLPEGTVKSRTSAAIEKLRVSLKDRD